MEYELVPLLPAIISHAHATEPRLTPCMMNCTQQNLLTGTFPARNSHEVGVIEKKIATMLNCVPGGMCPFLRSTEYLKMRLAMLYFHSPTLPIVILHQGIRVCYDGSSVHLSWNNHGESMGDLMDCYRRGGFEPRVEEERPRSPSPKRSRARHRKCV